MAYTPCYPDRINWQNEPSEATALNNVNLNKMDSAIHTIDERVVAMSTRLDTNDTEITNLQENVSDLQGDMSDAQDDITDLQSGKVDKVNGKGLSQVDNVTVTQHVAYGTVVSTIKTYGQDGTEVTSQVCNGIVVDSALSDSSTNPVQNKVVKSAIDEKSTVAISDTLATGTTLANITIDGTTTAIKGSDIEVDEELSPTSTNPVENKAIYDALNNLLPSKIVSGNPIAISDASGFNAKALTVSMNPIQDLHGYDHPWAGGVGKNKFSPVDYLNPSANLSATKNADGSVRIYGTPSSTWSAVSDLTDCALPAGQYTFSIQSVIAYNIYTNCYVGGTNTNRIITAGNTSITFTVTGTIDNIRLMISGMTVNTPVDITIKPMLTSGTDTVFAPYSNICPISGRTEASVTRTGKNKAPINDFTVIRGTVETFSPNLPSGTYSISFNATRTGSDSRASSCRLIYDDDTNYEFSFSPSGTVKKENITATKPIKSLYMYSIGGSYSDSGNFTLTISNFQIEEGSTATEYEPYQTPETHTKEFGQTVYGGWLNLNSGVLTIDRGIVDLGDFTWAKYTSADDGRFLATTVVSPLGVDSADTLCEIYKGALFSEPSGKVANTIGINTSATSVNGRILICDPTETDPASLKTKITGSKLCYKLATPTTIQLSPEALTLLKGLNVISTDGDNMELKYSVSLDSLLS